LGFKCEAEFFLSEAGAEFLRAIRMNFSLQTFHMIQSRKAVFGLIGHNHKWNPETAAVDIFQESADL
jgi:hypothetical protein